MVDCEARNPTRVSGYLVPSCSGKTLTGCDESSCNSTVYEHEGCTGKELYSYSDDVNLNECVKVGTTGTILNKFLPGNQSYSELGYGFISLTIEVQDPNTPCSSVLPQSLYFYPNGYCNLGETYYCDGADATLDLYSSVYCSGDPYAEIYTEAIYCGGDAPYYYSQYCQGAAPSARPTFSPTYPGEASPTRSPSSAGSASSHSSNTSNDSDLSAGATAGIVIGSCAVVGLVAAIAIYLYRNHSRGNGVKHSDVGRDIRLGRDSSLANNPLVQHEHPTAL